MKRAIVQLACAALLATAASAAEFHVAVGGNDTAPGTEAAPLRTIQHAADLAQPGDTVTVHEGIYRERVSPPRGGESDARRIVYRSAPGARAEIRGSEVITGWVRERDDVWTVTLPNSFFGDFNPYADLIRGDWFDPRGREHHTGAVYLDGDWLTEAASLDEVLLPAGEKPAWLTGGEQYLLNVAWLRPGDPAEGLTTVPAAGFESQRGVQTAACSEGGECIGWIEDGDWARYEGVDMGPRGDRIALRVASAAAGGVIEVRLDTPDGELLGACTVGGTGDWQRWVSVTAQVSPVSGKRNLCLVFRGAAPSDEALRARGLNPQLWFARVDDTHTTIWAQFAGVDPNERLVEINVRQSVFYPEEPGRNWITVRGFALRHAATPWAPPTAQQIGLIGTHWSKGWVIEDNVVSHSTCVGIALGKHGDEYDNTSANTAEGYVKTIERAHAFAIPWTRDNIGGHVLRNNTISHCEQAGVVGSLGAAFSTIEGNVIHDIHLRHLFSGAEMAGIKIHGAIDTTIRHNRIYRTCLGLWLDWMAQGTRVSANLFHDNTGQDMFVEVNHGPFLVDNNLFLSPVSLLDVSEGGAYAHNLFGGALMNCPDRGRETPFHLPHSTTVAGLAITTGGDDRFYNNVFVGSGATPDAAQRGNLEEVRLISGHGLWAYDGREFPLATGGNVYVYGAAPYTREVDPAVLPEHNPAIRLVAEDGAAFLEGDLGVPDPAGLAPVTTESLGTTRVAGLPYENPDGSPFAVDTDYSGNPRNASRPSPGPFAHPQGGPARYRVW